MLFHGKLENEYQMLFTTLQLCNFLLIKLIINKIITYRSYGANRGRAR
jgi:hypothetical protein